MYYDFIMSLSVPRANAPGYVLTPLRGFPDRLLPGRVGGRGELRGDFGGQARVGHQEGTVGPEAAAGRGTADRVEQERRQRL